MANKYSEDYFEHTKMTFGQHLEELRGSLWKAVLSLIVGFVIGLWFGEDMVEFITVPVEEALQDYYQAKAIDDLALVIAQRAGRDIATDDDIQAAEEIIVDGQLIFEVRYFEKSALKALFFSFVRELNPKWAAEITWPEAEETATAHQGTQSSKGKTRDQLVPRRAWWQWWSRDARPKDKTRDHLVPLLVYSDIEDDLRVRVISTGVHEPFMVYIKASLVLGALISSPLVFYFVWQFVAAGLYPHEKNYVYIFGPFSLILFLAGAALAFFAVIGFVLDFLFGFNAAMGIDPDPRISEWLSFVMLLPIGFGLSFQLPLVMLFLERIGIMSVRIYIEKWRISVLVIAVLSMLLTPADPGSMILMFVPLVILYFGGIGLCQLWSKRKTPFGEAIE